MDAHINFFVETKYTKYYQVPKHSHQCYELIYYLKGKGKTTISSTSYEFKENDFAIIRPESIHDESSDEGAEVLFMGFSLNDVEIEEGVYSNDTVFIKELMFKIKEEKDKKEPYYKQLMDLLALNIVIFLLRYPINEKKTKTNFDEIIAYVKMNSNKRMSIKEMANTLGYSYDYFRQMFIEKYHISAKDFIIQNRLETVKQYLLSETFSIDQVAKITGFSSSSHLCSTFYKYFHVSPKAYREQEIAKKINVNIKNENVSNEVQTYPGNRLKAITFSFDDNTQFDVKLVKLFEKYNLKCTFNINSGISNHDSRWIYKDVDIYRLNKEEMQPIYVGHEVAVHSLTHPHLFDVDDDRLMHEIRDDCVNIKNWFPKQKLLGMAYPYGQVDERIISKLKDNGILWGRTAGASKNYDIPDDLYRYTPTCHFLDPNINQIVDNFINLKPNKKQVLCIWGHSNELEVNKCWNQFEKVLQKLSNRVDIYYCTNSEALL